MKKFMLTVFCLMAALVLVACGEKAPVETEYNFGMGVVMRADSSKNAGEKDGVAQFDGMVAAVVYDNENKIVEVRVDAIQNKVAVNAKGEATVPAEFKTKRELGNDYHMHDFGAGMDNNGDGKVLEWFEQANAFEAWAKGKTKAEIEAMKSETTETSNGHKISTDKDLLAAGCTIEIEEFKNAVLLAFADEQGMKFKTADTFTVGVAATSFNEAGKTKNATAEKDGEAHIYVDFAANVLVDGKIVAAINDAIQPVIKFNTKGEITGNDIKLTKRNLKEDYHMTQWGSDNDGDERVLEWYLQSKEFSKFVLGKTEAEVAAMKTKELSGHQVTADDALLKAGCTIQVTDIIKVVAKAAKNAR